MKTHLLTIALGLSAASLLTAAAPTPRHTDELAIGVAIDVEGLPAAVTDADYYDDGAPRAEKVELGRLLFFDKLLSGNRNISCATCHHPSLGTSDGLALPLGEGPQGLGPDRRAGSGPDDGVFERVPRNSPALYNLGAKEFTVMFHDGRVEVDEAGHYASGFINPAKFKLPTGLDNALAAQAMFPVTSPTEMAGQQGENEIADAVAANRNAGPDGVWARLARRLQAVPEYVERFQGAFPDEIQGAQDITFVHAANAIAAFEATTFRADESPFDAHLRGERALSPSAARGMELFYGDAGCGACHSGPFQTDQDFHAIAMPQIGPGKSDGWNSDYWSKTGLKAFPEDFGRGRVTANPQDNYRFRTPSLRNVALTGPWGHAGTYDHLEDVVRHHLDPLGALDRYEPDVEALPELPVVYEMVASNSRLSKEPLVAQRRDGFLRRDSWVQEHPTLRANIASANTLDERDLTDAQVSDLVSFLEALTDPRSIDQSAEVPAEVPSGLPVDD